MIFVLGWFCFWGGFGFESCGLVLGGGLVLRGFLTLGCASLRGWYNIHFLGIGHFGLGCFGVFVLDELGCFMLVVLA